MLLPFAYRPRKHDPFANAIAVAKTLARRNKRSLKALQQKKAYDIDPISTLQS